ncbi:alpha/beta hydrolase [Marivirga sp. S37H4]|uniref:Alpha/beta hydrolase n=2 Tax=Marivirga aurantiaca TaxID=2802615 RepID=A0A935C5N8_9BACT|nr:alpha/beta hydrolase [Marivirga aurantiaca]
MMGFTAVSQVRPTIYLLPGQGSDKRIFDSLNIGPSFNLVVIEYGTPEKHMSMKDFAHQLAKKIDTSRPFYLVGVSLGGMLCVELDEILNPAKTIIISSAKNREELPGRYKFQKAIPFYKIIPGFLLVAGSKILQPIVEPDRRKNKETFKKMLADKKPRYMKRTVDMVIQWERESNSDKIYHIHGDNDHTLPLRKIKSPDYVLKGGSHMMTLTNAREVSKILNQILMD